MPPEGPESTCAEFSPQLGGARIYERASQIEGSLVALRRHVDEVAQVPVPGGGRYFANRYLPLPMITNRPERFGKIGRDIGPGALPARRIPFSNKLFERRNDC
jgi:hypothetical protein